VARLVADRQTGSYIKTSKEPAMAAKRIDKDSKQSASKGDKRADATLSRKDKSGKEIWRVASNGQFKTVITSSSSAAAMDDAVTVYSGALKRLAKR
jgi:hypothetical protein